MAILGYSFHPLSRNMVRRKRSRASRATRRSHHGGGLGGGLLHTGLLGAIIGLIHALLHHKKKHPSRGRHPHAHKPRKPRVTRAHATAGIRRSAAPGISGARGSGSGLTVAKRPSLSISTGVFDVRTRKIKRMRLLG